MKNKTKLPLILFTLYLFGWSPFPALADLNSGLVGYWNMDAADISGSTDIIIDRSGNGNTGKLFGFSPSTSSVAGKYGQAVQFNGASSKISIAASPSLDMRTNNAFTYSLWVNVATFTASAGSFVSFIGNNNSFIFGMHTTGSLLIVRAGGTVSQIADYNTPVTQVNHWYHLVATYDGTTEKIYVDAALTGTQSSIVSPGIVGANDALTIGAAGANGYFNGALDEVRIYNRALSAQEVLDLHQAASFDTTPLGPPAVPQGLVSPSHTPNSIALAWNANSEPDLMNYKLYQDNLLIAWIDRTVTAYNATGLASSTTYHFQISAINQLNMESVLSSTLSVTTDAGATGSVVTPGPYMASLSHPVFKSGYTLPPLTHWGWTLSYDTRVELSRWGYALEFGDADENTTSKLSDPNSDESKLVALAHDNPTQYKLTADIPRISSSQVNSMSTAYTVDAVGNRTSTWSPEASDNVLSDMAALISTNLQKVTSKAPLAVILNGGERYMGVCGWDGTAWKADPGVSAAMGSTSCADYSAQRKAHQEMFFTDAVRALTNAIYVYYPTGNQFRVDANRTGLIWDWDYKWMNPVADYPGASMYWGQFNSGYTGHQNNNDMLSQVLNAYGYDVTFGKPLSYNWVNDGWGAESGGWGDIERYYGFLKSYYTSGMIGGIAGYFDYPAGGFNAPFDSNSPPHWLLQIKTLGEVHAMFSYLEDILRNGDLLPGPYMNEVTHDQPAYEFPTSNFDTRVVARKMRGQNRWLISVWAADNIERSVNVTIPILGTVKVLARPAGTLYDARFINGVPAVTMLDPNPTQTPLALPAAPPDSAPNFFTKVRLINPPADDTKIIIVVKSDDPQILFKMALDTSAQFELLPLRVQFPSGAKDIPFKQLVTDLSIFYANVDKTFLTASDSALADGSSIGVTAGTNTVIANFEANMIQPSFGGKVIQNNTQVTIQANKITQEGKVNINLLSQDPTREKGLAQKNLSSLGAERDITFASAGTISAATIQIAIDRALMPKGATDSDIKIAYYNPATQSWEVQDKSEVQGDNVVCDVTHFSIYRPVAAFTVGNLVQCYAFPNPAHTNQVTIRSFVGGLADTLDLTIYDISGRVAHSAHLTPAPSGTIGNNYYYDYTWNEKKGSGVYFAVVNGKRSDGSKVSAKTKFAVVR